MKYLLFILSFFLLVSCTSGKEWKAFVYPYWPTTIENDWISKTGFKSLESCRNWALDNMWDDINADYECWHWCSFRPEYWVEVCKETLK